MQRPHVSQAGHLVTYTSEMAADGLQAGWLKDWSLRSQVSGTLSVAGDSSSSSSSSGGGSSSSSSGGQQQQQRVRWQLTGCRRAG
jgi:hypothetical protein